MKLFITSLFIVTGISLYAENDSIDVLNYKFIDDSIYSNLEQNLDSLPDLWYVNDTVMENDIDLIDIIPDFSDSVYIERLSRIPTVVPLNYNKVVKNYIDVYTKKRRDNVEIMLGLSNYYFPIFDDIFDYYDVPNEIKYMSIIESALNPRAYSRTRAVGIWQFMYGTGKMYGLEVNSYVDDRRDPIKSSHAAAKMTKDLYAQFGDWLLVIAAYNCGPGNVRKAIRRSDGKTNFWDIYYKLPRETRGHVPAFIAATYVMNYYSEHNLVPRDTSLPFSVDTVIISDNVHFKQISEVLNIPLKQLEDMNPQYRYDYIPGKTKPYSLILPEEYVYAFIDLQDSILAYKSETFTKENIEVEHPSVTSYAPVTPGKGYTKLYYTVKPGDNLGYISEWYGVGLSRIRDWNNIYKNTIRAGQKLVIYVPDSRASKLTDINSMTFAQKQAMIGKGGAIASSAPKTVSTANSGANENFDFYTVRTGDTLWEIARRYPGISDADIMKFNNLNYNSKIVPGQKLKIPKKI